MAPEIINHPLLVLVLLPLSCTHFAEPEYPGLKRKHN